MKIVADRNKLVPLIGLILALITLILHILSFFEDPQSLGYTSSIWEWNSSLECHSESSRMLSDPLPNPPSPLSSGCPLPLPAHSLSLSSAHLGPTIHLILSTTNTSPSKSPIPLQQSLPSSSSLLLSLSYSILDDKDEGGNETLERKVRIQMESKGQGLERVLGKVRMEGKKLIRVRLGKVEVEGPGGEVREVRLEKVGTEFGGFEIKVKNYYTPKREGLKYFRMGLCVFALLNTYRFLSSFLKAQIIMRLTIQVIAKYLGILSVLSTFPIFRSVYDFHDNFFVIGWVLNVFEALLTAYVFVFLLIILPSVALEHSSLVTVHNKGWKKPFLLILAALQVRLKYEYKKSVEGWNKFDAEEVDSANSFLTITFMVNVVVVSFLALYCLWWLLICLYRFKDLEKRYKGFIQLTILSLPLYVMNRLTPEYLLNDSKIPLMTARLFSPIYSCFILILFRRVDEESSKTKTGIETIETLETQNNQDTTLEVNAVRGNPGLSLPNHSASDIEIGGLQSGDRSKTGQQAPISKEIELASISDLSEGSSNSREYKDTPRTDIPNFGPGHHPEETAPDNEVEISYELEEEIDNQ